MVTGSYFSVLRDKTGDVPLSGLANLSAAGACGTIALALGLCDMEEAFPSSCQERLTSVEALTPKALGPV